jgi:hypothetical protein
MKYLVATGVLAMALTGSVHGEIYETRDDQGNPVFTDSPSPDAKEVELKKENIADPVKPLADEGAEPETSPAVDEDSHSQIVVIPNSHNQEVEDAFEEGQRREVLEAEPRREVLEAEPRREVGDFGGKRAH